MADFATLAALKAALDVTDTSKDVLLAGLNGAATQMLIDEMERDPRVDDFNERANGLGTRTILVRQYPILSVASVRFTGGSVGLDAAPVSPSYVEWDDYSIWRTDGLVFPRGTRNIAVIYSAGLDPMPKTLSLAAIYTVRALLTARKVDLNATGENLIGISSSTWGSQGPGTVPTSALSLIERYKRVMSV